MSVKIKHVVIKPFKDGPQYCPNRDDAQYHPVGKDVSDFSEERLRNLVSRGFVKPDYDYSGSDDGDSFFGMSALGQSGSYTDNSQVPNQATFNSSTVADAGDSSTSTNTAMSANANSDSSQKEEKPDIVNSATNSNSEPDKGAAGAISDNETKGTDAGGEQNTTSTQTNSRSGSRRANSEK